MDISASITTELTSNTNNAGDRRNGSTRYRIALGASSATEEDGTTILNVDKGKFYSLIGSGSEIWAKLAASPHGLTVDDIVTALPPELEAATPQETGQEVERFLGQLNRIGLISTGDGASERSAEAAREAVSYITMIPARLAAHLLLKLRLNKLAAFFHLTLVDLALMVGGFRELHRIVQRWRVRGKDRLRLEAINEICAAIDRACVYYPKRALCLQRSVVATCLLRELGIQAEMVIGCRKLPFSSHAWVEVKGIVVNDHKNVQTYYKILERI
jgi:Transglutaminase-like superfamily/Coenzyme PQQ synthesis protein D (PqqD)